MKRLALTILLAVMAVAATAQKPNIGFVYPAGGQQGTTFETTVGGQNLRTATGVVISGTGVHGEIVENLAAEGKIRRRRQTGEQDNPQLADRVRIRITVDPKAATGLRDLRLSTATGYSNRLFFSIDQLREMNEAEPNNDLKTATPGGRIPLLFNGQIMPGEKDFLSFEAKGGIDLVCSVKARVLVPYLADAVPGWFQAVLTLYDSQGREVAYCDDYRFDPDPTIICHLTKDDTYTLLIHDAIWRGREDFVYRISVGELPFITSIFPLGGKAGTKTKVHLEGVNLSAKTMTVKPPKGFTGVMKLTDSRHGILSNPVDFEVSRGREVMNIPKAAADDGKAPTVKLSGGDVANGVIDAPGRTDWYEVDPAAGEKWTFAVAARRLGSPVDAKLTLYDASQRKLAEADDTPDEGQGMTTHFADPVMQYKFPAAGRYYLRLSETQGHGGNDYAYRFHAGLSEPDFDLRIDPSSITIPQGGSAMLKISAIRKLDFTGEIAVAIKGLPAGYRVSGDRIRRGENSLRLTVTAPENAKQGPLDLTVTGTAVDDNKVSVTAMPAEEMMQAFYYTHLVPTSDFKVNVGEALPVRVVPVEGLDKPIVLKRNAMNTIKVRIERREGFDEPVQITLAGGAPFLRMKPVIVEAGAAQADLEVDCRDRFGLPRDVPQTLIFVAQVKPQQASGATKGKIAQLQATQNASVTAYLPAINAIIPAASREEMMQMRIEREKARAEGQAGNDAQSEPKKTK